MRERRAFDRGEQREDSRLTSVSAGGGGTAGNSTNTIHRAILGGDGLDV